MQRDIERLRRMAQLVEDDLRATMPGTWKCDLRSDYVLVIGSEQGVAELAIAEDVDRDNWPEEAWTAEYHDFTIDEDANEAIAEAVQDALGTWGLRWPICREHSAPLSPCSGVWACSSAIAHDLADVGALSPQQATATHETAPLQAP
ncbi:hypothetical protein [Blastococcus haudaquaticus]|uniref:Uncharacterized protein n=1 Tax=Blastococcus haudaquaticus TaxID=1938745 RepID=A0A286GU62_9ACTN|nr:hypothetical protein [Blastococcus haudaquaticus]SOD99048.1 hypothetical protein SAMN06272739_2150 [Blastococcus haudaquaticus]